MTIEHFDVLTIGAGLSGIGAAHHLQTKCADRSYAILEGRDRIGGTCSKPSHRAAHRSSPIKLICDYVCRLLNYMKRHGVTHCTPRNTDPSITTEPWVDFSSGYFQRSLHLFPKQGSRVPWKLHQNYPRDIMLLRLGRIDETACWSLRGQPECMPRRRDACVASAAGHPLFPVSHSLLAPLRSAI